MSGSKLATLANQIFSVIETLLEGHEHIFKAEAFNNAPLVLLAHRDKNEGDKSMISFLFTLCQLTHRIRLPTAKQLELKIGVHTGPTLSSIVGRKSLRYVLFGKTVETVI